MQNVEIINHRKKMCKLTYDNVVNRLTICFSGFLVTDDGAKKFFIEYSNITKRLCKADTTLVLDVRELNPFQQEFLDDLSELYKDYSTFKKVYCINSKNVITNLQTKRLIGKLGIGEKFVFVDSIEDVE